MLLHKVFSGDRRTALVKKNIVGSLLIRGWNSLIQFLLVPATLQCLTQYEYGIWLTINSLLIWIDQFDIGLGNGLRNKLAEAIAINDYGRARKLTSTTFLMLIIIIVPFIALLIGIIEITNCHGLFNVNPSTLPNLKGVLQLSVSLVGATFIFKFIGNIFLGLQLPAINNLLVASGRTLSLISIIALVLLKDNSLMHVAIAYTLSPLAVYLISYPITFHYHPKLRPTLHLFDKKELRSLFSLGVKFFLVQIGGAILFTSSNFIISNTGSPEEVTPYQICYYYFSVPLILFSIIIAPIWTATTDAYTKGEWTWIHKMENKMRLIVVSITGLLALMALMAPFVYQFWIGDKVQVSAELTIGMAIYIAVIIFSMCYSNILYGLGKIWLLTLVTLFEAILFIPLSYILGKEFGTVGIVVSLIIVNSLCAITNFIQFKKIVNKTATGIWNR